MPSLRGQLELSRCPHCNIDKPNLLPQIAHIYESHTHQGSDQRFWRVYFCRACGGGVLAGTDEGLDGCVTEIYPPAKAVDENIPDPAKTYLHQAIESIHTPVGSVMLSASAVDAMLKLKNSKEGTLNSRIDRAACDHIITQDMAAWAHEVRLDANDQRHADESQPLPDEAQAKKCVDFALALADVLFVLPSRVERGRKQKTKTENQVTELEKANMGVTL